MGDRFVPVMIFGSDREPIDISSEGRIYTIFKSAIEEQVKCAVVSVSVASNQTLISAPGSSTRIVVVGYTLTWGTAGLMRIHFGTGSLGSDPTKEIGYWGNISNGGVAFHLGAYSIYGGSNEALYCDNASGGAAQATIYYYTEAS